MNTHKKAFTLIELLVVVLIIGVLAAIALPQYQKAVTKARLADVHLTFNVLAKAVDVWLLQNGGLPDTEVKFLGQGATATLDIDLPWASCDEWTHCYTKLGAWYVSCSSSDCLIEFDTAVDDVIPWLGNGGGWISFIKPTATSVWELYGGSPKDLICTWWQGPKNELAECE